MFGQNVGGGGLFNNQNQNQGGGLFGGGGVTNPPAANIFGNQTGGANAGGGLFGNNVAGGQANTGGGIFGTQNQPQTGLTGTFGPVQTLNPQQPQYGQGFNQTQKHEHDVDNMLKQHQQIMKHQQEYSKFLSFIQDVCKNANQNLVQETQKLRDGKSVLTNKATNTIQGGINNPANANVQQTEKKGINTESIEQTGQNLEKIREKNELIFAKLFEIHCLIERISSNANTIERDSNAEMRLFRQFNDVDTAISQQNQKLIDLNQKIIDAKNNQEGGEIGVGNSHNSSARVQNGSLNNQNIDKRKKVLIDMLEQMKKGVEIVKEQHQADSKDFEILIKKLNQSRTHPF